MTWSGDLDQQLREVLRHDAAADPAPALPGESIRLRAGALAPRRRGGGWRWWLALGVAGACLSGTAVAMASPQASGSVQQVLAGIHALPVRPVTLEQAQADAGYTVVKPAGLPAGTRLKAISELPALGAAPAQFLFQYQTAAGPFEVAEGPADGPGGRVGFYVVAVNGRRAVFAGEAAAPPAPPGAITGAALPPGAAPACPAGAPCTVQVIHAGAAGAPGSRGPVHINCPADRTCAVQVRNGHLRVTVAPVGGRTPGPPPPRGTATAASWTVGGTEVHLINPGSLSAAQVAAIRSATGS